MSSRLSEMIDRIKDVDYEGADLNQLRDDMVDVVEALRDEIYSQLRNHLTTYHASEI